MPPTGAETMVKDLEYKNWLRVGLALYFLKVGLCSFIQGAMDAMHQSLLQKLYGGSAVPASQCSSCNSKDVKQNRNSYAWNFRSPCPHSLCDTWLTELLAFHTNATSSKLYWENCDVTAWPRTSWECAKLYMPRGQPATNTGPAQSDSQALLTLMANCTYFHSKLSQGGIQLTHTVSTIRNRVMHSEDMRLSDNDRKSFIQNIINLLEDSYHLKSLDECKQAVAEINKINNDSLDVFNIDFEMKALSECVNDFRQELGVHKVQTEKTMDSLKEAEKKVDSLKEELKDLKVQFGNSEKETKDKVEDIDTKCKKMGTRVTKLSRTVTSGLKHVKGQVRTQNASYSVIKKAVHSLKRKAVTDQSQQNKKLRKLNEEIQLIKGSTAQALRATAGQENMESDVRDIQLLLIKAYESVQIISINPVFDTAVNWKDLEDFYTDIVIEEEREESGQGRKDEQQVNKEKVTSFRQVFRKGNNKVTRIILKAPAGQGKSTFCRKLVHTWCSVQKKKLNPLIDAGISDKSETNGLKDEDEMLRFDVLLYICLRDISDEKTLMDVIYTQFPLHESQGLSHKSHIEALIGQTEDNKVLLIMDGLDEMDNTSSFIEKIMQRSLYPHLTVLATTRPWKIDKLRLIRSAHIDLLLDLQGFSYANSMLYAKRIFDKYYKDESAIAQFQQDIMNNSVIKSLINVPLLLLFIVHVWYEKKSFPQTIHELYMEILNVMVSRYMEGKERKEKSMGRQDEKKYLLLKTWPSESMTFIATCKLRNLSLVQHFGEGFLAALCEVANHFLITDVKETSLVFEEKALVELLGKDGFSKLQRALELGILSNSEMPGIFRKKICLAFLHKTVQEFLAAINICCREDRCKIFLDSLNTIDDVLQNEKIIMFVAGISTIHCQKIFEKIYEVCDKDRASKYGLCNLNKLYRDCIREAGGGPVILKLFCGHANNQKDWNVLYSALWSTSDVRTQLKWLHLASCNVDDVTFDFSEFVCLEQLSLGYVTMKGKLLLSKCTQLESLNQQECSLDDATLDLLESNCLKYISLVEVTMKGKLLLSKCTQLESLKLQECSLDDATLDLLESNCLKYISLVDVTMKGKLLLSKCTQLKSLKLQRCILDDATLDLLESNCLKYISLVEVTMKGKLLLSKCTQLESLKLQKCSLDDATLDLLESNCLKYISLVDVTVKGKLLPPKCTQLKSLKLQKCSLDDATLDLLESNCLKYISLVDVTIKDKLLLSKCTQLECLKLQNCSLDDVILVFSESNCLKVFSCNKVTMTGRSRLLLSKCTGLTILKMQKCILDDATLDLSEVKCLEYISLVDVTMKGKLLLTKCTRLRWLNLASCILDDAILDVSESTYLERFECNKVTITGMSRLSKCTLLKQLMLVKCSLGEFSLDMSGSRFQIKQFLHDESKCKQIQHLTMKNVDLDDVLLSQESVDYLDELTLDNVTVRKDRMEMLFKNFSKSECLTTLSFKNMDLDDALLSSYNFQYLHKLELDNVTISMDSKMFLFVILSQFEWLMDLSLKNLDLSDGLHELYNMNRLTNITLDNVEMGKTSKVLMCKSLSQCTQLVRLSLKNLDLGDGLLSLKNLEKLHSLAIDNVTMCKDGYVKLCNSMSTCAQLKHLQLMNLILDNTKPSVNILCGLELVNINISLQCVHCIRSSVQHWRSLHYYSSAHTRELIIEKVADVCETCGENNTNKRVLDDDDDDDDYEYYYYENCYCDGSFIFYDEEDDEDDEVDEDDYYYPCSCLWF